MDYQRKRELVDTQKGNITLEGVKCNIAGWANDYATISPHCGGFWHCSWETVKRVIESGGAFTAQDVEWDSWRWLGVGVEVPPALWAIVPAWAQH